jgi:Uma2 family endonuclease
MSKLDEKGCRGAPDLIVEILSPSNARKDMKEKRNLYERSGIRE